MNDVIDILQTVLVEIHRANTAIPLQALPVFTGRHGKPKIIIPKEHLEFFIECCFSIANISKILGVSKRTVERHMHEFNCSIRSSYSNISDISDEALVETIKAILSEFPQTGYRRESAWYFPFNESAVQTTCRLR